MGELHRTLKVLRDDADARRRSRASTTSTSVLDGARAAGVPITLAVEGAPRALAPALDASAYRIVQEAVTNVIRHAGGAPADGHRPLRRRRARAASSPTRAATRDARPTAATAWSACASASPRSAARSTPARATAAGFEVRAELPYDGVIRVLIADDQPLMRTGLQDRARGDRA